MRGKDVACEAEVLLSGYRGVAGAAQGVAVRLSRCCV